MQNGDIVVICEKKRMHGYSTLGKIVSENRFWPMDYGRYYSEQLVEVTDDDVRPATEDEKIEFISHDFPWGKIIDIININNKDPENGDSNYLIVKFLDKMDNKYYYHPYIIKFSIINDTHTSYTSLDSALIGVIAYKHGDERAAFYIDKMLGI